MPKENLKEEEEDLVIVGDSEELEESEELEDSDELDESPESEESRLGASDEDEGEDGKKLRRKQERTDRRQRQKDAKERNQRELHFLRTRNEELERRQTAVEARVGQTEISGIDQRISQVKKNLSLADEVMGKAMTQNQGEDFVEAQSIRDNLRDDLSKLQHYKQQVAQSHQGVTQAAQVPTDPQLVNYAKTWMQEHAWWNPQGQDEDSLIVSAIDKSLAQENYNPATQEYWNELSKRVQNRLPHRSQEGNNSKGPRKGGPQFSTGGRQRSLKKNEVYVTPERRQALEEAGVWDDPQLRQKYLKQYQQYDRDNNS